MFTNTKCLSACMRGTLLTVTLLLHDIGATSLAVLDATRCFTRQDGEVCLYGIFDGHSGSKVAAFAAQRMPEEILLGQLHGRVTDDGIKDVLKQVVVIVIL